MISIVIIVISLILDGLLSNFLPFMVGSLSFFTPLFTVMSIFLIYPFFKKKEKRSYFMMIGIAGIIYDLLYTNLLFFHALIFLVLGGVVVLLYRYLDINFFMVLIEAVIIVFLYQGLTTFLFFIMSVVPVHFSDFLYLVEHTLLINIIYTEIVYFITCLLPKKYLGLSIN